MVDGDDAQIVVDIQLPFPFNNLIEIWNPSVKDIEGMYEYLEINRKILLIWVYGTPYDIPDYSSISNYRVANPFYLGISFKDALFNRTQALNTLTWSGNE